VPLLLLHRSLRLLPATLAPSRAPSTTASPSASPTVLVDVRTASDERWRRHAAAQPPVALRAEIDELSDAGRADRLLQKLRSIAADGQFLHAVRQAGAAALRRARDWDANASCDGALHATLGALRERAGRGFASGGQRGRS
jgi:hypothetical protein